MLDGETVVIEDNVSILHGVTLGGTGTENTDRHPKIRTGVLIGAGAQVIGNIEIGAYSKIAAGSLVTESVPPRCTAVGVPARIIQGAGSNNPAESMDQCLAQGTYESFTYVIYPDSLRTRKKGIAKRVDGDLTWRHDSARLSER